MFLIQPFDNDTGFVENFIGYACNLGLAVIIHFAESSKFEGVIEVMRAENAKKLPRTTRAFMVDMIRGS